ncbi:MAG: DUF2490 domain-containing protein [Sphingobacteriales bacterium]
MRKLILSFSLLVISKAGFSQTAKSTEHVQQVWLAYLNQTRLSDKWGLWLDVHLRTKEDFFTNFSQTIFRSGLTYYINDDTKLTLGYAYVNIFPGDNHKNISQPEHRPWQQIQWHTKYPKLHLTQWIRLEERYRHKILNDNELADGYSFNFRLRYNFFAQFPLSKKRFQPNTFSFVVNDELHVNFGKQIVYNYFDQNRFFLGFNYHVNKHDNLQFGWTNVFQQLAAGNKYRSNNAARIFFINNLDLRNKQK